MRKFRENINLSEYSNYKIGGPAKFFFEARSAEEVEWTIKEAKRRRLKVFILGGGTNLLIGDGGFPGLVLKPNLDFIELVRKPSSVATWRDFRAKAAKPDEGVAIATPRRDERLAAKNIGVLAGNGVSGQALERSESDLKVGAGAEIPQLLDYVIMHSLSGLEWAGGLPGTLGGAIRGNAGCFGGEIKDVVSSVESFDTKTMKVIRRDAAECAFGYRTSIFKKKKDNEVILSAELHLRPGERVLIAQAITEKVEHRRKNHPLDYPNVGSIFKNVPLEAIYKKGSAQYGKAVREGTLTFRSSKFSVKTDPFPVIHTAKLISESGLRGVSFGGAMISAKHPNFIVNVFTASATDVKNLIDLTKKEVFKKFRIKLEEEIGEI